MAPCKTKLYTVCRVKGIRYLMQRIESDAIHLPVCVRQFNKLQIHQLVPPRSKGNERKGRCAPRKQRGTLAPILFP
jgi:hypothetical protein